MPARPSPAPPYESELLLARRVGQDGRETTGTPASHCRWLAARQTHALSFAYGVYRTPTQEPATRPSSPCASEPAHPTLRSEGGITSKAWRSIRLSRRFIGPWPAVLYRVGTRAWSADSSWARMGRPAAAVRVLSCRVQEHAPGLPLPRASPLDLHGLLAEHDALSRDAQRPW